MHPHVTEIVPKARLHKGASVLVKRLARRPQYIVDDRWNLGGFALTIDRAPLQVQPLLTTGFTIAACQGVISTVAFASQDSRRL